MDVTGVDEHHVAVTCVPDPKHGERLCVLYTDLGMSPAEVHGAPQRRAPCPRYGSPRLGTSSTSGRSPSQTATGKVDLRQIRQIALNQTAGAEIPRSG